MSRLTRLLPLGGGFFGALAGLAVGQDLLGVVVGGMVGGGVGLAADRRSAPPRPARIDPFTLGEPWRRFVQDSLKARSRFTEARSRATSGPIKDRFDAIGERVDDAVETAWRIAGHGQVMADARRRIDVRSIEGDIAALAGEDAGPHADSTTEALRAQLGTAARIEAVIDDTQARLRLLNARLNEAVARSLELSSRGDLTALDPVDADVERVADELEALRLALDETDTIDGSGTAQP